MNRTGQRSWSACAIVGIFWFATFFAAPQTVWAQTYTTSFPLTENPVSEGGHWINGGQVGLDWFNVQTTPGRAFGTVTTGKYTDPTALLTGSWGADQTAEGIVFSVNPTNAYYQEVELRLRSALSAHSATGYEIAYRCLKTGEAYVGI